MRVQARRKIFYTSAFHSVGHAAIRRTRPLAPPKQMLRGVDRDQLRARGRRMFLPDPKRGAVKKRGRQIGDDVP